jgi:hypothetical protein
MKPRKLSKLGKDRRRKHRHFKVTLFYKDGESLVRMYTDHEKAKKFADRQKKSPVVKRTRVNQVS